MDFQLQNLRRQYRAEPTQQNAAKYIAALERIAGNGLPSSCEGCPHLATLQYYTSDSWEFVLQWHCKKTGRPEPENSSGYPSVIDSSHIGFEEDGDKPSKTPDWCPLGKLATS